MSEKEKNVELEVNHIEALASKIEQLVTASRTRIASTINTTMVYTYYEIGRYIVEDEQGGKSRAKYGKSVLKGISKRLTERFGSGWSVENLTLMRKFFMIYSDSNVEIFDRNRNHRLRFLLPWTHYQILLRVENPAARQFYEIEALKQQWSKRRLQREIGSCLYERLALSRSKDEIMRLSKEGQTIEKPSDIIKDPIVLEFVGLKPNAFYTETNLERALIDKLQSFLLEMGKGFLFEARQKRFTFEERNFYVDLVLYNRLLQCYVLVDLKMEDLTHQDLGQMQMYVNYYDRFIKQDFENPTIGILLCERKNDALVELTLPDNANIYAQQYALYLPEKKILQEKFKEWLVDAMR